MIAQWRESAMDRMRLINRPEGYFSICVNCARRYAAVLEGTMRSLSIIPSNKFPMRERNAIQSIFAKALIKAREADKRVKSLQLAVGELSELDQASIQKY